MLERGIRIDSGFQLGGIGGGELRGEGQGLGRGRVRERRRMICKGVSDV